MAKWFNDGVNEYYREECPQGCISGRIKREKNAEKWAKTFPYDVIYQYYITENHNKDDTAKHFNIPKFQFRDLLFLYGINKKQLGIEAKPRNTRTHEQMLEAGRKSAKTQRRNWANKSDEEKKAWSKKMSESHKTANYANRSKEINRAYRASLTEEERALQNQKRRETLQAFWREMSPEEKYERINKQFNGGAGYHTANSKPNLAFKKILEDNNISYKREFRIGEFCYDFLVNDNVLIEIDPTATHNATWSPFENNKAHDDKRYHYSKSKNATDNGYRCIHIFDWDDVDKIISLLKDRKRIYARECDVRNVTEKECEEFISTYHLQGYVKSKINYGLYYNDELVSVMTFGQPRYNKKYEYELLRFCSKYNVIGGSEKLFKHFIDDVKPTSVISYCDYSKFSGKTYIDLGFTMQNLSIGKHWYNCKTGKHITDNLLRSQGFDRLLGKEYGTFGKGTSNIELIKDAGFVEVYDCGQITYIYQR